MKLVRVQFMIPEKTRDDFFEACARTYTPASARLRQLVERYVIEAEGNPRGFPKPMRRDDDDGEFGEGEGSAGVRSDNLI